VSSFSKNRKLVAALAVRNQGSRLYGKPLQNLHIESSTTILTNIVECLKSIDCIDEIVLGVAEGIENDIFIVYAKNRDLQFILGNEIDVLARLIACGELVNGTDIFRVTSESPFPSYGYVQQAWEQHLLTGADATFYDNVVDGCGFEIIKLDALKDAHKNGEDRHRTELCTLYLRENSDKFNLMKINTPDRFVRTDLRLTVDNPEDLIVCKAVYKNFVELAPRIPLEKIIEFLDMNPNLITLIQPFTESGYESMYIWGENEKK
jgi:spore coat polysaccharide biosynthesis protein SpsF